MVLWLTMSKIPHRRDLSRLSRTCSAIKAVVLPILYSHLVLKIPCKWVRLCHLENLLASNSDNLQHVTSLSLINDLNNAHVYDGYTEGLLSDVELETIHNGVHTPHPLVSSQLNMILRILLQRLPRDRLTEFVWVYLVSCTVSRLILVLTGGILHVLWT